MSKQPLVQKFGNILNQYFWVKCAQEKQPMAKPTRFRNKWRIRWTDYKGVRQSDVFTHYKDAEWYLKEREIETQKIRAGLIPPPKPIRTFNELCDFWIRIKVPSKRNGKNDISIINKHLIPRFGTLLLSDFKPSHGLCLQNALGDLAVKTVHNILTLLISMLNAAREEGWIDIVPKIKKPRVQKSDPNFRYLKSVDEIKRFLTCAKLIDPNLYQLYSFAIHSGLRAGELAALRFSSVNLDHSIITVSKSWNGPTKSGKVRPVPLTPAAREIFIERLNQANNREDLIFTNSIGKMLRPSDRVFQERLRQVLKMGGFNEVLIRDKKVPYINFHSLRHTFASHWAMQGLPMYALQEILGHQSNEMTKRYSHLSNDALKGMGDKFINANHIQRADLVDLSAIKAVRQSAQVNGIQHQTPELNSIMRNLAHGNATSSGVETSDEETSDKLAPTLSENRN